MTEKANNKTFYTIMEAADFLGIGRSKMYQLAQNNEVPVRRIGKLVRIPKDLLEEYAKNPESFKSIKENTTLPKKLTEDFPVEFYDEDEIRDNFLSLGEKPFLNKDNISIELLTKWFMYVMWDKPELWKEFPDDIKRDTMFFLLSEKISIMKEGETN